MVQNRKKQNKIKSKKKATSKTSTIAVLLVVTSLSAFGLWKYIDDSEGSPLNPIEDTIAKKDIDLGNGVIPDPTVVNESALLKNEEPSKQPKEEKQKKDQKTTKNEVKIKEAGEEPTKEELEAQKQKKLDEEYPLYAVAYHFHTQIKETPKSNARVIAYTRRGSTFKVSNRVSTKGCKRGWHETAGGGYICDGVGFNVSKQPVSFSPAPPKPDLSSPLPYAYKYAKKTGTAEYWKLPTEEEIQKTNTIFSNINKKENPAETETEKYDKNTLAKVLEKAKTLGNDDQNNNDQSVSSQDSRSQGDGGISTNIAQNSANDSTGNLVNQNAITKNANAQEPDGGTVDPYALPAYVHLRMAKGYFVSVDDIVTNNGKKYQRTVRGRYIQANNLYSAKPSKLKGVLLNSRNTLPMVFVIGGGVKSLRRDGENGPFKSAKSVKKYSTYPLLGEVKRKNKRYVQIGKNEFISSRVSKIAKISKPPKNIEEGEKWIDINLKEQTLVAYEGATPVFATIISSGRKGFETPVGSFNIYGKHVTITMDDLDGGDEAYSIEDVPWTQYFKEGYALHAAFWHDRFGRVRSHGCINLSPADARRLFFWTGPHVAEGIHGTISTKSNSGTIVIVHK